jgi:hypothetical protein
MQAVLCKTMAALLFVHAAFGCCWQRANVWNQCASAPQRHACCKHEGGQSHQDQQPTKPCKQECQGVCTYLRAEKVQIDASQVVAPFEFVAFSPTLAGSRLSTVKFWEVAGSPSGSEPPLRLHLLHQILLI